MVLELNNNKGQTGSKPKNSESKSEEGSRRLSSRSGHNSQNSRKNQQGKQKK